MSQTVNVVPTRSFNAGTFNFGPASVPTGVTDVQIQLDRTQMTSNTLTVTWSFQLSLDGGVTWQPWGGGGTSGAALASFVGNPIWIQVNLPQPTNANRQVKGSVVVNETVTSSVTLLLLP